MAETGDHCVQSRPEYKPDIAAADHQRGLALTRELLKMSPVSTLRLNLLRACYLLLVVGLAIKFWPVLFSGIAELPRMEGAVTALLSAMGFVAILGLFSPLRMLPLLLFEVAWKAAWVATVAVPAWQAGTLDDGLAETLFACTWVVPFFFIIPWRHVARTYLRSGEPWRG
ncbi:MAG: hypothetical protein EOO80_18455 [Oxalobacteraceae bacterium]|nr:MAG: hypothetical protein EOO80_18455 [Oxalobacteraceae bacterium]